MKGVATLVLALVAMVSACSTADAPAQEPATTTSIAPVTSLPPQSTTTSTPPTTTTTLAQPPALVVVPELGSIVGTFVVEISGTTSPDAVVTVDGVEVAVATDGTFQIEVLNRPGLNEHAVVSSHGDGRTETSIVRYEFVPSPTWAAAIGDSVMLGSKAEIEKRLGEDVVDATVSRQFNNAPALVRDLLARPVPPEVIIIGLGTNGPVQARHFDEVMGLAADVPLIAFVNVRVPRSWEATSNRELAEGVERYDNAVLVDWWAPTHDRDDLFAADGVHPKQPGRVIMAELIASAIFPDWTALEE